MDLNSDIGESFGAWILGDDDGVMRSVTSVNVACGFHAGDPSVMRRTCAIAAARGITVGAHVGYRDLAGFGRRAMSVDHDTLRDEVSYQIGALQAVARSVGATVQYVKPHGALYNTAMQDALQAAAIVDAIGETAPELALYGLPGSALLGQATAAGLRTVREGYADRAYTRDGRLAPRSAPGSVLTDIPSVVERVVRMATSGKTTTIEGAVIELDVDSVCVHGDTPAAVDMAAAVRTGLEASGVAVQAAVIANP